MLKHVALAALLGATVSAQQSDIDPVCMQDSDCEASIGCNTNGALARGIPNLFYCNQPDCTAPEFAAHRTDGICNNLQPGRAYWGALHQLQIREGSPSNAALNPSVSELDASDTLFNALLPTPNTYGMSNLLIIFGQFVDHDITLVEPPSSGGGTATILSSRGGSITQIIFPLSDFVGNTTQGSVPEFVNGITATLDLTQVYGSTEERTNLLRETNSPLLRTQRIAGQTGDFLPDLAGIQQIGDFDMAMGNVPLSFAAGDVRANEQLILTSFHTLFLRNHNKLAGQFDSQFPAMTNDQIFELARARNIAEYQNIVFQEFVPGLVGSNLLDPYTGYDSNVNPQINLGFATALYRMGHSGVSNDATAIDSNGVRTDRTLADVYFAPEIFIAQNDAVGAFLLGSKQTCHERLDLEMSNSLRRLLFANRGDALDLGALNLRRGVDHQLMSLNSVRQFLGMPTTTLNQATSLQCVRNDITAVYGPNMDNIPLFAAGLMEDPEDNSQLGPTITASLVDQFQRLRDGDRYYFENTVNGLGLDAATIDEVRATTLSNIIQRNTFITPNQIGTNAFESDTCCFRGGKDAPNMMCSRSRNGFVTMQAIDLCDVEDMATTGAVFYPGTIDPATNIAYDCNCIAATGIVSSSSTLSASAALIASVGVTLATVW